MTAMVPIIMLAGMLGGAVWVLYFRDNDGGSSE